jgi:hypothetical protein
MASPNGKSKWGLGGWRTATDTAVPPWIEQYLAAAGRPTICRKTQQLVQQQHLWLLLLLLLLLLQPLVE